MSKDDKENEETLWPSLNEAHGISTQKEQDSDKSWELLREEKDASSSTNTNPRTMLLRRNSFSTPDLRKFVIVEEKEKVGDDDHSTTTGFSLVENASTTSDFTLASSPQTARPTVTRHASFLDAVKQQVKVMEPLQVPPKTPQKEGQSRTRVKPKFVVVAPTKMKRCAKSTGDLTKLAILQEEQEEHHESGGGGGTVREEEEVLGDTDAMDYYHRKAKGYSGRRNGLKERPDEAKRKEISMYKKDMQRLQQQKKQSVT